jgi:hypothetical protein
MNNIKDLLLRKLEVEKAIDDEIEMLKHNNDVINMHIRYSILLLMDELEQLKLKIETYNILL